ncbi:hypothetical protein FSARC_9071 [Fusarium sarcochroum]|uniref:Uncharacterized protein n=1 Tax=Fusarium sarcochroum TaxID=1208366 RepID=A0A8H4TS15_9HYPO|nr:hypothetical protein FSARC_9071 [Fusarium sarcochroum]
MTTPSHVGGSCAAPDCESIVLFSASQFCTLHQFRASQTPSTNDGPSATSPRTSRLSDRGFVAKRGRGSFLFKSSARPSGRSHSGPKPDPSSRESSSTGTSARATQSPIPKVDTKEVLKKSLVRKDLIVAENKSPLAPQQKKVEHAKGGLVPVHKSSQINTTKDLAKADEHVTTGQVKSPTVSIMQKPPNMDFQIETEKTVNQPCDFIVTKKNPAPVTNMGLETSSIGDSKMEPKQTERSAQSPAHKDLTLTKQKNTSNVIVPEVIKKSKPSPGPSLQQETSNSSVKPMQLNSQGGTDPKSRPHIRKSSQSHLPNRAEYHIKALKTSSSRSPLTHAKRPTHQAGKTLPSRKASPQTVLPEIYAEIDDEVNMADVSDSEDEEVPQPNNTVLLPFRAKAEARRKRLLARFDSAAFDSLIYRQSNLRPPAGVVVPRTIGKGLASSERKQIFLPVNPAIHKMHKRSPAWYKKKCEEIRRRPGRKAWFGKVVERKHWIQDMEVKLEKQRQQARLAGAVPPFKQPQPLGVKRILDFGDVPEEELPDYVRRNPAWLKACAWHRECQSQAMLHQRRIDRSTNEAERFFHENFSCL